MKYKIAIGSLFLITAFSVFSMEFSATAQATGRSACLLEQILAEQKKQTAVIIASSVVQAHKSGALSGDTEGFRAAKSTLRKAEQWISKNDTEIKRLFD